jgi:hypothetical protein
MDKTTGKEINKFKKRHKDFLETQGKILFLYLDGIITSENENLSEMVLKDGVAYYIDKQWCEIEYSIKNDSLNKMIVKTSGSTIYLTSVFGMNQGTLFEDDEKNEEEILSYFDKDEYNIKIKEIEKVREYNW